MFHGLPSVKIPTNSQPSPGGLPDGSPCRFKNFRYLCPELQNKIHMKDFLSDMKQSAPWWLMLILQVVEAIIQYLTNNPS